MGINLNIRDVKPGYFPVGKGYVCISVSKCQKIKSLKIA
jgi:RNA 3'-terminal phosphate cyclase